jgi:hypothetical protein
MSRTVLGLFACLASLPLAANTPAWQVIIDDALHRVAIDPASVSREGDIVRFLERRVVHGEMIDSNSMRPVREILSRRMADCLSAKLATLSRSVFSDGDALIDHLVQRPHQRQWTEAADEPAVYALLCGRGR